MIMDWKKIYKHLHNGGFEVYAAGQHQGICERPYLVLKNNGGVSGISVEQQEYELLLYYPVGRYSEFEDYIQNTKEHMNKLYPVVWLKDGEYPHYPDDDVKAYMTGIIYATKRISKINRL